MCSLWARANFTSAMGASGTLWRCSEARDLAQVGSVRGRTAYWIANRGVDHRIKVRPFRAEWVVAGCGDFIAALPPPVLANYDAGIEVIIQADACTHAAEGGFYRHPVSFRDAAFRGDGGVHFHFGMRCAFAQTWQSAVLALTKKRRLGTGKHEREAVDQLRLR